MKHLNNLACMLAMLTAGSMGFTACSSDDVVDGGNTNNGVAGKMVKTSFALNIPYGNKSGRMTAENTQANNTFTHMNEMRLLAFDESSTTQSIKKIVLANGTEGAFDKDTNGDQRYIYRDVTVPVGTNKFYFYGKKDADLSEKTGKDLMDEKFTIGSIVEPTALTSNPNGTTSPDKIALSSINFALEPIYTATEFDVTSADASAKAVAEALAKVYNAEYNGITWRSLENYSGQDAKEKHASNLFNQFKNMKAGSAASVRAALEMLIKSCGRDVPTGEDATASDMLQAVAMAAKEAEAKLTDNTFPRDLGLPDGAAKGAFSTNADGKGVFTFAGANASAIGDNGLNFSKVTYPAELDYYVETDVKAKNDAFATLSSWPAYDAWKGGTFDWDKTGDKWDSEVKSTTRTIALEKPVQYAVASLETIVDITASTLNDNAIAKGGLLSDQQISVTADNSLELTGVLIGAQPEKVGSDYKPVASVAHDYTVYDRNMNQSSLSKSTSATNYTLVLENSGVTEKGVYITIELKNNTGVDFYGADGVVPAGGTFYLVGQLNPAGVTGKTTVTDKPANVDDVFVQDHKTVAKLHIGANSLKNAYNTIPDLRSTQISLGLAVDLTWEAGITFDVNL